MRLVVLISVALIFLLGLMMVFNTSAAEILDRALERSTHQALVRQLVYAVVGFLLALLVWKIGYQTLVRAAPLLLTFFTFLLLLVFLPGIGRAFNGAHRWLGMGGFTFQPSEFVKLLIPMAYIEWIKGFSFSENLSGHSHLKSRGKFLWALDLSFQKPPKPVPLSFVDFCKLIGILALPMALVMLEPDNGTTAVMAVSLAPLFYITGVRLLYWVVPMVLLLVAAATIAYQLPYIRARIEVYRHPELDLQGKGHQPHQAKIATGSGGLWGRGPGGSLQKFTYLPEAQNDYIAAIYAEEFGFVGMLLLMVLYMLLIYGGFFIAMKAQDAVGSYLATALTFLIAIQAFLNLSVVSGLLPSKGANLPFFSQGGTSLLANIFALTLLLNVDKEVVWKKDE